MHTTTLSVKFISPCFNGGGTPRQCELRTFSIRGQLRWWYRICGANLDTENQLFGSSSPQEGQSKLKIRLDNIHLAPKTFDIQKGARDDSLTGYLWYYMKHQKRNPIQPGTTFDLILRAKEISDLKKGTAIALTWISFGGLGSRLTRAAGSMDLVGGKSEVKAIDDLIQVVSQANRPREIWEHLLDFLPQFIPTVEIPQPFKLSLPETGNNFNDDWLNAAKWLASRWKSLRNHETKQKKVRGIGKLDHDEAITAKKTNNPKIIEKLRIRRATFGMPYQQISFRPKSPFKGPGGLRWKISDGLPFARSDRLASPVHLRLTSVEGSIMPAILIFPSRRAHCPERLSHFNRNDKPEIELSVDTASAISALEDICNYLEI